MKHGSAAPQSEVLREAIDEVTVLFGSMLQKVMLENPTWDELDGLLTADERRTFDAFMSWASKR